MMGGGGFEWEEERERKRKEWGGEWGVYDYMVGWKKLAESLYVGSV